MNNWTDLSPPLEYDDFEERLDGDVEAEPSPLLVEHFTDRPPREMDWLIHGLCPQRTMGFIAGEPESLKTWLALDMMIALATGTSVIGFGAQRSGTSLVYSPEGEGEALRRRLHLLCKGRGVDYREVLRNIGVIREKVMLTDPQNYVRLGETLIQRKPDLLILDPLVSIHGRNENDAAEMSEVFNLIRGLSSAHPDVTVLVVHHTRKVRDTESPGYAMRGTSAAYGWSDTLISIRKRNSNQHDSPRTVGASHRDATGCGPRDFVLAQKNGGLVLEQADPPMACASRGGNAWFADNQ